VTLLKETLEKYHGNRSQAARALGLQRTYLLRLIREYHIDVPPPTRRHNHNGSNR
jgi:DNA-binding NtrC family response regulator